MQSLVKKHTVICKLKGNKRSKNTQPDTVEVQSYIDFLECNRHAMFHGLTPTFRFCFIIFGLITTSFSKWDDNTSKMEVWEYRMGCPFGMIDFWCISRGGWQGMKGMPFYKPFMLKLLGFKLPHIRKPHVWLWNVDQNGWQLSQTSTTCKSSINTIKFTTHICKMKEWWHSTRYGGTNRWGWWAWFSSHTTN